MSTRPPPPPRSVPPRRNKGSGEHEAVQSYRAKLDSIVDGAGEDLAELDRKLQEYLDSDAPPPPEGAPKKPKGTPP